MPKGTIIIGTAFREGWTWFKARAWFWIGIGLICTVISEIVSTGSEMIPHSVREGGGSAEFAYVLTAVFFLLNVLVSARISMGMAWMGLITVDGKMAKIGDLLAKPQVFWRYVVTMIAFGLMFGVGLVLLIVPGIYVAARFFPVHFVVIERETGVMEGFRQAQQLTEGYRGKVINFILLWIAFFVVSGIAFIPVMRLSEPVGWWVMLLSAVIATPIIWLSAASLYRTLQNASANQGALA